MARRRVTPRTVPHHDLLIIGAGSGNSIIGPEHDGMDVAIVEPWEFGGTCMNRGCIPSKMFVHAADLALSARRAPALGVHTTFDGADWPAIRDRVFGRIDPIAASGRAYRHSLDHVTVYEQAARFIGDRRLRIGDHEVTADQIVVAAGARSTVPDIPGLAATPFQTSDTVMRLDELPDRLAIVGGGFIAVEMAHVFSALGSQVTIVHRGDLLLRGADEDLRRCITTAYADRMDVRLGAAPITVDHAGSFTVSLPDDVTIEADQLLIATGRRPNTDTLDVAAGGMTTTGQGHLVTDQYLQTDAPGVWALGDITNPVQLKHTANQDARIVRHNLAHPDDLRSVDRTLAPYAVFGHPQIATVGPTEADLVAAGRPYLVANRPYADTAYGWAMEDTTGFVKLLADPDDRRLLAAHIIGPQAPTLIQQLIQGMAAGQTVDEMAADQYYIHPAMPEVVEQALLEF